MGACEDMARNCAPTFEGQVQQLENIRRDGNTLFAERNWAAAVCRYSQCIDLASVQAADASAVNASAVDASAVNVPVARDEDDDFNRVVVLAFSNRAEVRLRLQAYAEALDDAERALQIDPKHVKTLVRKGKAAHALELYQKACEAFQCALDQSPEEQSIQSALRASRVAVEQSRNGHYDLADFFCGDGQGPVPSCADFVGPVEIRRKPSVDGRARGLFATKSLEPGELLFVSNPVAADKRKLDDPFRKTGFAKELVKEVVQKIKKSELLTVRFSFLASDGIPAMELFRRGSEWIPPRAMPAEPDTKIDANYVHEVASRNMIQYMECGHPTTASVMTGLWILPAFAKHSCAPNCHHSLVGQTLFYRASRHIEEGEELTISYFTGAFEYVTARQSYSQKWMFTCKCERCVYEETLLPQLSKIHENVTRGQGERQVSAFSTHRHLIENAADERTVLSADAACQALVSGFSNAGDEVEAVIKSLGASMLPKQKNWIRASFLSLYVAQMNWPESSMIDSLRLIVETEASAYVTRKVLESVAMLLMLVQEDYSKASKAYRDTLDQARAIYCIYYGKTPDALLHKLIEVNVPAYLRP